VRRLEARADEGSQTADLQYRLGEMEVQVTDQSKLVGQLRSKANTLQVPVAWHAGCGQTCSIIHNYLPASGLQALS
jgi:hypothetical protein